MCRTGFEDVFVDFDLSSRGLVQLQVGVVVEGLRAGRRAVGRAASGAVGPPEQVFVKYGHELEDKE